MITCTLNGKKYSVDFISGRALREIDPARRMYERLVALGNSTENGETEEATNASLNTRDALDVMVQWFCLLFKNQFTPDEVYDGYPADKLMRDIIYALLAVQACATETLSEFPMPAAQAKAAKKANA